MNWAVVIGVDEYGSDRLRLSAAVADAERFRDWVLADDGGRVPRENLRLLLARRADDPGAGDEEPVPTKDNVVTAINEIVTASGGAGERLYFFFAGHGITARVSNRDESALVTPGFDEIHPDHSLAIRSLTEFLETTQFRDQFFFVDACRDVPWRERELEIGRWPIPRKRDPGKPPVQQFILYATSPGLTAAEVGWPDQSVGAFTDVLMEALEKGKGRAKAWSWERNCYEVRWENLATYVKGELEKRRHATRPAGAPPPDGWPIQIPQDTGARGVAGRDRDALLVSFPRARFDPLRLTVELRADPRHDEAEISVLDAVGEPVASALKVVGDSHTFELPPKTYAVRAKAIDERVGRVKAPIDLYEDRTEPIELEAPVAVRPGHVDEPLPPEGDEGRHGPGVVVVEPADPLTVTELCDEAGNVVAVSRPDPETGQVRFERQAGFYRVRAVGPEATDEEQFVILSPGEEERAPAARPPKPSKRVVALGKAAGGRYESKTRTLSLPGTAEPLGWATPSTIVAVALGEALAGSAATLERLGLPAPAPIRGEKHAAVALYAVADEGGAGALRALRVRLWQAGDGVPQTRRRLQRSRAGLAGFTRAAMPGPHWLALEQAAKEEATVLALPVFAGRLATVIAEVKADGLRLYQFHPVARRGPSSAPERLRRVEHLERLLLAGRLDAARQLAEELAAQAADDPFAACLAGYVLLRLGIRDALPETVAAIVAAAPELSDAYVLRGEHEAAAGNGAAASQAFADAVGAGIPVFGEGLTRLVEGLRASGFNHPRGALVRHLFQRHARGSMWAAFTPRRKLEPGRLVVSGADIGFEG